MYRRDRPRRGPAAGPALALAGRGASWSSCFLAENARIPVDDPNTHLELTMIHEVMVLDHGGPDLAFIQYGAALKLWVLGALLVGIAAAGSHGRTLVSTSLAALGGHVRAGRADRASSNRRWRGCGWCACRSCWSAASLLPSLALVLVAEVDAMKAI